MNKTATRLRAKLNERRTADAAVKGAPTTGDAEVIVKIPVGKLPSAATVAIDEVRTPHGFPCSVDWVSPNEWPSAAAIYSEIDPKWYVHVSDYNYQLAALEIQLITTVGPEPYDTGRQWTADKIRDDWLENIASNAEFDAEFAQRIEVFVADSIDKANHTSITMPILFDYQPDAIHPEPIDEKTNPLKLQAVDLRYNPIFRRYDIGPILHRWGLDIRKLQDIKRLRTWQFQNYISNLYDEGDHYVNVTAIEKEWYIVKGFYAKLTDPHWPIPCQHHVWCGAAFISAMFGYIRELYVKIKPWVITEMDLIMNSTRGVQTQCHGDVMSMMKTYVHLEIAKNIIRSTNHESANTAAIEYINLHAQLTIMGNIRALAVGGMYTLNDQHWADAHMLMQCGLLIPNQWYWDKLAMLKKAKPGQIMNVIPKSNTTSRKAKKKANRKARGRVANGSTADRNMLANDIKPLK